MSYLVLAYPHISEHDYKWIQNFRREHDELLYQVVEPHFTIVFPTFNKTEEEFICEIEEKSNGIGKIDFSIHCSIIDKDAFNEYWHIFLTPDQGYSSIVKLHDRLYSGKLKDTLILEIPFIPHVGIGNSRDKWHCKELIDEINSSDIQIHGRINALDIVRYENDKVETLKKIFLL